MTMENNELNKKIIENVRSRVVISNLESEATMKLNKKKQILSLMSVMTIMFAGSFITVNAATDGELTNKVKDAIKVILIREDGTEEELHGRSYIDSNNNEILEYEKSENGREFKLEIDKTNLEDSNLNIDVKEDVNNDGASIVISNKQ